MIELKELCENFIVPQRDKPKEFGGDIPWCRIEDIEGKYLNGTQSGQYVTEETIKKMNLKVIPQGAVICSCSASLGVQAILSVPCITNQTFIGIVPKDELDSEFLYYFLKSKSAYFKKIGTGTTIPYISRKKFEDLLIPRITLDEQAKIVDVLKRVETVVEDRKCELKHLDDLIKARFVELFGNKGENPNGYEEDTLGNLYKFQYGKGNNIPEDKGEYPCYGSNGQVGHHTEYNSEDAPIIGHIGAYAGIVNWGAGKHYVTYNGVICNLKTDRLNPIYGFHLLQQQDFNRVATKGGGQPFVSYGDLESPVVVVPPIEVQEAYAEFTKQVDKSKFVVQKALDETQLLFDSLMQEYFG